MLNIISNSLKFTQNGFIKIKTTLHGDSIHFKIKDSGIGMTEDQMQKLFKEFQKGEDTAGLNNYGSGLGLSICKKIIEKLGGDISVESHINIGTKT